MQGVKDTNVKEKILERQSWEKQTIKENHADVQKANSRMLNWLLKIGLFSFSILLLVTFFAETYVMMRLPYFIMITLLLLIMGISRWEHVSTLTLLYCSYGVLMGIVTFTSSFITSDVTSALALMLLFQIPIVILDQSLRISLAEVLFMLIYIVFVILYKDSKLIADECVNAFIVTIIGLFLGGHLRRAQIDNFDLKRQAVIRENTDALTGLYNRRKLYDCLMEVEKQNNGKYVTGVVMIDIDSFKLYNDTYGHQAGDECLKKVSAVLRSVSQESQITFFRYGGEEFAGVTYEYGLAELFTICKKIAENIYNMRIPNEAAQIPFVTVSIGLTGAGDGSDLGYEQLLLQSDRALYAAKNGGKNKAVIFNIEKMN